jgi:hypothetical protein
VSQVDIMTMMMMMMMMMTMVHACEDSSNGSVDRRRSRYRVLIWYIICNDYVFVIILKYRRPTNCSGDRGPFKLLKFLCRVCAKCCHVPYDMLPCRLWYAAMLLVTCQHISLTRQPTAGFFHFRVLLLKG